jgi:hypothetical protein
MKTALASKNIIIGCLFSFGAVSAMAQWIKIEETSLVNTYVNLSNIEKYGTALRSVGVVQEFKNPKNSTLSQLTNYTFDCERKNVLLVNISFYNGHMGAGERTYHWPNIPAEPEPIKPNSVNARIFKILCN